jgi:hypothetical protein
MSLSDREWTLLMRHRRKGWSLPLRQRDFYSFSYLKETFTLAR